MSGERLQDHWSSGFFFFFFFGGGGGGGGKLLIQFTICSLCILTYCNLSYFPRWFKRQDFGSNYISSWSSVIFYFRYVKRHFIKNNFHIKTQFLHIYVKKVNISYMLTPQQVSVYFLNLRFQASSFILKFSTRFQKPLNRFSHDGTIPECKTGKKISFMLPTSKMEFDHVIDPRKY